MAEIPGTGAGAHIGKSVVIKGELSGSEDLFVDGRVTGTIELRGHTLTIGPNGQVSANVHAKSVTVHGKLEGDILATERVELRKSAIMVGAIAAQRVSVEDGAYLKGQVDTQKDGARTDAPAATARPVAAAGSPVAPPAPAVATSGAQNTMFDTKK
jgi:cytoskeletal protein CcmA (bactofilin family)